MLFLADDMGNTVWHMTVKGVKLKLLHELLDWAKKARISLK